MRISDWSSDVCAADDIVIGAEAVLACDGEAHLMQAGLDLILAIDRVRRGQERAIGLAAEHIIARRSTDLVGRVRLAAGEFSLRQPTFDTFHLRFPPRLPLRPLAPPAPPG